MRRARLGSTLLISHTEFIYRNNKSPNWEEAKNSFINFSLYVADNEQNSNS